MKKLFAIIIMFSVLFSGKEIFALEKITPTGDLTEKCGLSEQELAQGMKDELVFLSEDFLAAEEKYSVNAVFLAAVAALESGWGKSCFLPNNIFGWNGKSFSSKSECVDFVASKLAEHYLSEDGKYYNGKTVSGVNLCYNGSGLWAEKVSSIMTMIMKKAKNGEKAFSAAAKTDIPVIIVE